MSRKPAPRRRGITSQNSATLKAAVENARQRRDEYVNWERDGARIRYVWERWAKEAFKLREAALKVGRDAFSESDRQRDANRKSAFQSRFAPFAAKVVRAIGRTLKAKGYVEAVEHLTGESDEEKYAIDVLWVATAGHANAVESLLRDAFKASLDFGQTVVLFWLADRLRFRVLNVNPADPSAGLSDDDANIVEQELLAMGYSTVEPSRGTADPPRTAILPGEPKPKPMAMARIAKTKNKPGRKKLRQSEVDKREPVIKDWKQAKETGVSKKIFCHDRPPLTVKQLNAYLAWERKS